MAPILKYTPTENFRKLQITQEKTTNVSEISPRDTPFIFTSTNYPHFEPIKITDIQKLPSVWKETFKIKLDKEIEYTPCDAIGLMIPNPDWMVDELFKILDLKDLHCRIERAGLNSFIFEGSVRDFIKHRMDLKILPKKRQLLDLSKTAKKKESLEYLCSPEGTKDYLNMGLRMNTLLEIIKEFECKPSFEDLVNNCEIIKPRYYSLIQKEGSSEILLGVIERNIDDEILYGHSSDFIRSTHHNNSNNSNSSSNSNSINNSYSNINSNSSNSNSNSNIEYCFRKNKLFESLKSKKLLCFCTGTGIAPYIAFYRKYLNNGILHNLKMVYGYRNEEDNLVKYYDLPTEGILFAKSGKNEYVQDFVNIISEYKDDYCVFICGNMKMQKSVFDKIKEMYPELINEKRIYFDNWS